jgi:hypothetical protein
MQKNFSYQLGAYSGDEQFLKRRKIVHLIVITWPYYYVVQTLEHRPRQIHRRLTVTEMGLLRSIGGKNHGKENKE